MFSASSLKTNCHILLPENCKIASGLSTVKEIPRKTGVSDLRYQFWLSDSAPAKIEFSPDWVKQSSGNGQAAIMELTTYSSIHDSVYDFIQRLGIDISSWVKMQLTINGETPENIEEAQAIAFANQVGQLARELNSRGITEIHLFCRIPPALALLIGQRLLACGRINLYWFDNPTYRFAFTLS